MDSPIDLRFALTRDEFIRPFRRMVLTHPLTIVVSLMVIVCLWYLALSGPSSNPSGKVVALMMGGVGAWWLVYAVGAGPGKAYERRNLITGPGEISYRFTPTGVEAKGESFQTRMDWNLCSGYSMDKDGYQIHSKVQTYPLCVPRRAFASPELEAAFHELLKAHLKRW